MDALAQSAHTVTRHDFIGKGDTHMQRSIDKTRESGIVI
jgi:hypothetical protein